MLLEKDFNPAVHALIEDFVYCDKVGKVATSSHDIKFLQHTKTGKKFFFKTYDSEFVSGSVSNITSIPPKQHNLFKHYLDPRNICSDLYNYFVPPDPAEKLIELTALCEALASIEYRMICGTNAAKVYALYEKSYDIATGNYVYNCIGSISEQIPNFVSAQEKPVRITEKNKKSYMRALVAGWFLGNDDNHKGNYGQSINTDSQGNEKADDANIKLLDFDMANHFLTWVMKGIRYVRRLGIKTKTEDSFKISRRDCRTFPILQDTQLVYWYANYYHYMDSSYAFRGLKDDATANYHKYLLFIFLTLIPDDYYEKLINAALACDDTDVGPYIGDGKNLKAKFLEIKKQRRDQLKKAALDDNPAVHCLLTNKGIFGDKTFFGDEDPQQYIKKLVEEYNLSIEHDLQNLTVSDEHRELLKLDSEVILNNLKQLIDKEQKNELPIEKIIYAPHNTTISTTPEKHKQAYEKHKQRCKEKLIQRRDQLHAEYTQSEGASYMTKLSQAADALRGQPQRKLHKINWLNEVIENTKNEDLNVIDWLSMTTTPNYPYIREGRTGKVVDEIKSAEYRFAEKVMNEKLNEELENVLNCLTTDDVNNIQQTPSLENLTQSGYNHISIPEKQKITIQCSKQDELIYLQKVFLYIEKQLNSRLASYKGESDVNKAKYNYCKKVQASILEVDAELRKKGTLKYDTSRLFDWLACFDFDNEDEDTIALLNQGTNLPSLLAEVDCLKKYFPLKTICPKAFALKWCLGMYTSDETELDQTAEAKIDKLKAAIIKDGAAALNHHKSSLASTKVIDNLIGKINKIQLVASAEATTTTDKFDHDSTTNILNLLDLDDIDFDDIDSDNDDLGESTPQQRPTNIPIAVDRRNDLFSEQERQQPEQVTHMDKIVAINEDYTAN